MSGYTRRFIWLALLLVWPVALQAQSKKSLQQKKSKLQNEINEANKLLRHLSKSKKVSVREIGALKRKIGAREELIRTMNQEVGVIKRDIRETENSIRELEREMKTLKSGYADMIRLAHKHSNRYEKLMYIFAADDFNQALKRMKFLRQVSDQRRAQAAAIDSAQVLMTARRESLESQKKEKTALLANEIRQKDQLDSERKDQDRMLTKLKSRESKVKRDLAAKRKAKARLERAIADIIRREVEEARRKAALAEGKKDVSATEAFALTPEARKLSKSFAGNKGALPWPVEKGVISGYFGEHAHPTLRGVKIKNDGIDIMSSRGSRARSIFRGEVSGTVDLPGSGAAVIIRHGEYLSVYSNLERVFVKKGDRIDTRQEIGVIGTDEDGARSEINLQIWKGFSKLNPTKWIARN